MRNIEFKFAIKKQFKGKPIVPTKVLNNDLLKEGNLIFKII